MTGVTIHARAVLLDMDGTLVDSAAVVERVWTEWAIARSMDPAEVMTVIHGRQAHESLAVLLPGRPAEENRADSRVMELQEIAAAGEVVAITGAARLLEALGAVPHALVTSATAPLARARMTATGLPMPEVAITAEGVSASKPDPEGFLAAAAALGVPPRECVVFEDSGAGIVAAHAAGMRVIGVGRAAAAHGADWAVADLADVRITRTSAGCTVSLPSVG